MSRLSTTDRAAQARQALGKAISPSTGWRIVAAAAIKPWRYQYWIFPRDPHVAEKAGRVLALSAGDGQGTPLGPKEYLIRADEKASIQARLRCPPSLPPAPGRVMRVEHAYERGGALQYLAAWAVRRGLVIGRCEPSTGIAPFGRLVAQVMEHKPYRRATRVFWIVANGSSHRGETAARRLAQAHANLIVVHTPLHARWLNQVGIYFPIVQRKVLTPNDFASLAEVGQRLRLYEALSHCHPHPCEWKFTRAKLGGVLNRLHAYEAMRCPSAVTQVPVDSNQCELLAA